MKTRAAVVSLTAGQGRGRGAPLTVEEATGRAVESPNVIYSYIAAVLVASGNISIKYALEKLGADYGTRVPHNMIAMWRVGSRPVPRAALQVILRTALPWVLNQIGIDRKTYSTQQLNALSVLLAADPQAPQDVVQWLITTVLGVVVEPLDKAKQRWVVAALQPATLRT